jgi:hypothetical protein
MMGAMPQDEEMLPADNDDQDSPNPPFNFFGFGQEAPVVPHFQEQGDDIGNLLNDQNDHQ